MNHIIVFISVIIVIRLFGVCQSDVTQLRQAFDLVSNVVCRTDELKFGDLIGTDEHGNKYYQNKYYFLGKLVCFVLAYFLAMKRKKRKMGFT